MGSSMSAWSPSRMIGHCPGGFESRADAVAVAAAQEGVEEEAEAVVVPSSASATSSDESVAGWRFQMSSTMPISPGDPAARNACTPRPCARSALCIAWRPAAASDRPGAKNPTPYPTQIAIGSLSVAHRRTRSPNRSKTTLGVLAVPLGDIAVGPAAAVLERLRKVPVVQRHVRFDAGLEQPSMTRS